jgi:hypothetical protein
MNYKNKIPLICIIWLGFQVSFGQTHTIQDNTTSVTILPSSISSTHIANQNVNQNNLVLGQDAMFLASPSAKDNVALGQNSMNRGYDAKDNIVIGLGSNYWSVYSDRNIAIGTNALYSHEPISGDGVNNDDNVAIGHEAMKNFFCLNKYNIGIGTQALQQPSQSSVGIGYQAGKSGTDASVLIGYQAGMNSGYSTVAIGYQAAYSNATQRSVFLGYMAGYSEATNDKLYIENTNSTSPLIGGDFANDIVGINVPIANLTTLSNDKFYVNGNTRITGALLTSTKVFSSTITTTDSDDNYKLIYIGTTNSTFNLTLPGNVGRELLIVNHGSGNLNLNMPIITGFGTTISSIVPGQVVHVVATGSDWHKIN